MIFRDPNATENAIASDRLWEKVPGSGVWWIRYRIEVKLKREKVGRKGHAIALYQLRKSDARTGAKSPDNMRNASVRFKEIAEAIREYSAAHHRDTRNINSSWQGFFPISASALPTRSNR